MFIILYYNINILCSVHVTVGSVHVTVGSVHVTVGSVHVTVGSVHVTVVFSSVKFHTQFVN